ncbi:acetyltransferase [Dyadobacter frigoris]|uniref:Acetyltransferase n=1 Tax=Dyadobacter frigoris TaxID=2576211 RepID=A0A4U6D4P0_9BACT|nr:acetyltransferase [Dyadobacter frigoris]TKT91151.1 acetyltransferase [Dyadobacter frigoris]GLU55079.1 acetyltransferase [Dyadobacter frigoris]
MLIYGAGGHAKVIISCILANQISIDSIFDDNPDRKEIYGMKVAGFYDPAVFSDQKLIISIGDNLIRRKISGQIKHAFGIIIHPSCIVDKSVKIREGTVVLHNAVIQADSTIGRHVIINTSVSVDHDCIIGDFVHLAPGVILSGNVCVEENTLIGVGSIIAPGLTVGKNCFVTAGSVVTHNIPDGVIVRGNPARIISRHA